VATAQQTSMRVLRTIAQNKSIVVPILVLAVIAAIIIPLPPIVLDFLIATNLTLSITIILISMYIDSPVDFSIFPSLILLMTLYRLALNIASTRLILSNAGTMGERAAGTVIGSFGTLVIAGNYVIGAVIFLLIIAIQYIVISQGSVRIGEVSARFTLDAMPGKQMAIDADLNAGFIDEREARARRELISQEASFYGAMDGAVRFTRRDAIASLIITLVNIIGGLIIGTTTFGMDIGEAATVFTTLTIGDGLVSALPSLVIAVAAGLVVTRSSSTENLGDELATQFYFDFRPLAIGAGMLALFALFLPETRLVFLLLGAGLAFLAYQKFTSVKRMEATAAAVEVEKAKQAPPPERVESLLRVDPLGLEVGYNLIPLVDINQGNNILDRIKSIRRQIALEMGIVVPPIRIRDNLQLEPNEYTIMLRGVVIARGRLMMGNLLAMSPGKVEAEIEGEKTSDPAFGLPAIWIPEAEKEKAQISGYTVVDTATVISTHLTETIKNFSHQLLGRQEVQALLDLVSESAPKLVEEAVPKTLPLSGVQKVLQNLLRERVSIRDLHTILEAAADYATVTSDYAQLTEFVRMALGRSIIQPYLSEKNELAVITLNPELETSIANAIVKKETGSYLAMEPHAAQNFLERLRTSIETAAFPVQPILLASGEVRLHIRRLTERFLPGLVLLSHGEIPPQVSIINLGVVG